jgi:hypothetical protein
LLLFVANGNEECSALTNEIIVTMHTFQDVSCAEALRKGRALEGLGRGMALAHME